MLSAMAGSSLAPPLVPRTTGRQRTLATHKHSIRLAKASVTRTSGKGSNVVELESPVPQETEHVRENRPARVGRKPVLRENPERLLHGLKPIGVEVSRHSYAKRAENSMRELHGVCQCLRRDRRLRQAHVKAPAQKTPRVLHAAMRSSERSGARSAIATRSR